MTASDPGAFASPFSFSLPEGVGRLSPARGWSQHGRLILLHTPLGSDVLIVERFSASEAISELFHFEVDCIAQSGNINADALLGEEVTLRLRLANGEHRSFHGIVTRVHYSGVAGQTRCRLTLEPWLQLLALRRDSYVFQDMTVPEIVADVLGDYEIANYRFDVATALPKRSLAMQYRETDYDFLKRLLAEEGLSFYFAHEADVMAALAGPEEKKGSARHQLVIFDDNAALAAGAQPTIRYHRASAAETTDTIVRFAQHRTVAPNVVTLGSWDYKKLAATSGEYSVPLAGDCPPLEVFEGAGAYRYTDAAESSRIAQARAESLALSQQRTHAESSARAIAVGTWFELSGHAVANGEYAVLSVTHEGENNLSSADEEASERPGGQRGTYRNRFTTVPRSTRIRPEYLYPKPLATGTQSALVVGIRSEEISTDRDHRVKLQFPWQRGTRAAPGQLSHPSGSNAPGDETAGTWVRVAGPSAGANWGTNFVPRIGQEVCVDFIGGDIDRPIITGQLYNGADAPLLHGADNHAGALTGIRTKEYAASGFNQWMIDDTPGQLRQTLASSGAASQLNAGYLIRQNGNMRGPFRGIGFELATDAWSTLRAKRGLFISTAQRQHGASTQLDTTEAQARLAAAAELTGTLSDAATRHQADSLSAPQRLKKLREECDGADDQRPGFAQPVTLFDSSAGVITATPASSIMLAAQDASLTSDSAMRITAGEAVSFAASDATSLFTHAGGARAVAAKGTVSARAHSDAMDVFADNAINITSSNGTVKVLAKQEILLASCGGYIKLAGSNIDIHCPASVSIKGVTHGFLGAESTSTALAKLPDTRPRKFDD